MKLKQKFVWVGPKESDILYSGLDFFHSITFNGSNSVKNTSFTSKINTRIDHISDGSKWHLSTFLQQELCSLLDDPDIRFLFYNPAQGLGLGKDISSRMLCVNPPELISFFRNKANMRTFAQECIPVVPFVHFTGKNLPHVQFNNMEKDGFILQTVQSSSGAGTHQLSLEECENYTASHSDCENYILSPYLKYATPINVHIVVFDRSCIVLPPSFQLISHQAQDFCYMGADFHTGLSFEQYGLILSRAQALGEKLRMAGYRGICGIDFMLTTNELYFLEINPRFQASSFLCNKLLLKEGKPSLHRLNLTAFSGGEPPMESFDKFQSPESFFTLYGDWFPDWLESKSFKASDTFEIIRDGLSSGMELTPKAYLCRVVTGEKLCWLDPDFQLRLAPNIQRDTAYWRNKVCAMDPLTLKIGLLNQGIRFSETAYRKMERLGSVRTGVFQSIDLTFPGGFIINSPYHTKFSELTPYCVQLDHSSFYLSYEGTPLSPITLAVTDPYRDRTASGGTLYRNAAFLATDRLRVHHELRCRFKEEGYGCRFCNVRLKTGSFSIQDVCEVIDFYLEHMPFRHFLIGGGSGSDADEHRNILALARYIRSRTDMPIYAMCLPPTDLSVLSEYYGAGIDEIGFNLELFNRDMAAQLMPGKGKIPLAQYEAAYKEAVRLWGRQGAVRSLMVLGLDPMESFYRGIEWLCTLGVMPIISVFRPIENIELSQMLPPENKDLADIFLRSSEIAAKHGLILGPACAACQNNTLSLPL